MSQELINLSEDLKRLRDEGYELEIRGGYALVHHIPYVNLNRELKYGTLISSLTLAGNKTTRPDNHVIHFQGEHPCNKEGNILTGIQYMSQENLLGEGISINHSFSNKPSNGYQNYYEKFTSYIEVIRAPAYSLDSTVSARTYIDHQQSSDSVFNYFDTNSSRANIGMASNKLENQKVGIVGLGGTGSYVLDFVSKTPVLEIHLFDGDDFLQHNAFRAPGAPSIENLRERKKKTDYFKDIYSHMHKSIFSHSEFLVEDNLHELINMDFVFICVDEGVIKKAIIKELIKNDKSFIDVGIGIEIVGNSLIGEIRVTTSTPNDNRTHLWERISFSDSQKDEYASNIQIADLNALNAVMAVIKWKKIHGFYQDIYKELNSTYSINTGEMINAYE
ncbi:ThiF family adenylyltransferase [Planomicrobium okeanokoites]|uniref:ThiF family adenylyltransferase n=1 Tax=Planomicrobium okeanokoites TaxID=244 RepID=UPI0024902555|nr:ThiF family adenylyltransferase [Planomicrobium okeanokoites]